MKEKVILVIDDDEMNLQIAKMVLERKLKCKVIGADNGLDGIDILKRQRVNLVLLDVMMPDFDGVETLMEIRNDEQIKNIPIMMLTASGDIETIQKVGMLGVKDYIKKPFLPADLISRVNKKLEETSQGTEVLLVGTDKNILRVMQELIEDHFSHEVIIATNAKEILNAPEVSLIIGCADMNFIDGVKILNVLAKLEKFKSVPFALTTPEKIIDLLDKMKPQLDESPAEEISEKPDVEEVAESAVVHEDKKKLANVVTTFIGYKLDLNI